MEQLGIPWAGPSMNYRDVFSRSNCKSRQSRTYVANKENRNRWSHRDWSSLCRITWDIIEFLIVIEFEFVYRFSFLSSSALLFTPWTWTALWQVCSRLHLPEIQTQCAISSFTTTLASVSHVLRLDVKQTVMPWLTKMKWYVVFAQALLGNQNHNGALWLYDTAHIVLLRQDCLIPRVHETIELRAWMYNTFRWDKPPADMQQDVCILCLYDKFTLCC